MARGRPEWIEGAGHTTPIEEPSRVAELLARFVAERLEPAPAIARG